MAKIRDLKQLKSSMYTKMITLLILCRFGYLFVFANIRKKNLQLSKRIMIISYKLIHSGV